MKNNFFVPALKFVRSLEVVFQKAELLCKNVFAKLPFEQTQVDLLTFAGLHGRMRRTNSSLAFL